MLRRYEEKGILIHYWWERIMKLVEPQWKTV